jgi:hypothetical protein
MPWYFSRDDKEEEEADGFVFELDLDGMMMGLLSFPMEDTGLIR